MGNHPFPMGGNVMKEKCIAFLNYITEAIDKGLSDTEINERIEEVANNEEISNEEYCQIYELVMEHYKEMEE